MRHFLAYADTVPDRVAVIGPDGGTTTFAGLRDDAYRVAALLAVRGVAPEETVAALLPNSYEMVAVQRGVLQLPVYFTAVNWHLTVDEIRYVLVDSGARLLFVAEELAEVGRAAAHAAGLAADAVVHIGHERDGRTGRVRLTGEVAARRPVLPPGAGAGAKMLYTSGTTGRPKGVRRPLRPVPPAQAARAAVERAALYHADHEGGRYLSVAPLYHAAPGSYADQALDVGHTVVIQSRWDARAALAAIEKHRVTWTYLVPLMFQDLLALPAEERAAADLSAIRSIIHTAAPCPPAVKRAMIDWLGPVLIEIYGGTEGSVTVITSREWLAHPGSVGRARAGVSIRILGPDGEALPPGAAGTIYFDNAASRFVYLNDPEKTAATRVAGHVTLGDVGHLDADGYLYLGDRGADLIISGGVNIYPAEVEHALLALPGVHDACVVGRPDPKWGESVHAVVVADTRDPEELTAGVRERIAGFKVPRSYEFVAALPRSETGKLLRRAVRDRLR